MPADTLKPVHVRYFAILREQRGVAEESFETEAATATALYQELQTRHGLAIPPESLRVAINDEFVPWETEIKPGDRVVFIPPVAGG